MNDPNSSTEFFQDGPELGNQFSDDVILRSFLSWRLPKEIYQNIEPGLTQLGQRVIGDILDLAKSAEANPPKLIQYDSWGKRIDYIQVSSAWNKLHHIAAREGIVATAYERKHAEFSRVHQFVLLYLFHPSSAMVSCPLAMTDGAAQVLECFTENQIASDAFMKLTAREPKNFWTSGQWMTERTGGSDVSGTTTIAKLKNNQYSLYGTKWFTSATTADMALALAKIEGENELSLFYLKIHDEQGRLNDIEIHHLKDKLGTRALPTAELTLKGVQAILIGKQGEGIKTVANMLNVTRLYNAVCALAYMRRGLALANDYAHKREAFGRKLIDHPLHVRTLKELQCEFEGGLHLVFQTGLLLGKHETQCINQDEMLLLRLLIPVAKLYTGKQVVGVLSEVIECFGGAGYIEDTGLPTLLRDAQVLPIWEGTTNVLSLDVLRVLAKPTVFESFAKDIQARLSLITDESIKGKCSEIDNALRLLQNFLQNNNSDAVEANARKLAFSLARIYICSLIVEHAQHCQNSGDTQSEERLLETLSYWTQKRLTI